MHNIFAFKIVGNVVIFFKATESTLGPIARVIHMISSSLCQW